MRRLFLCSTALTAVVVVFTSSVANAVDVNVPANTSQSGQVTINGTDTLTVGTGASLSGTSDPMVRSNAAVTGVTINNSGRIESTGTGTRAIRFQNGGSGAAALSRTFTINNFASGVIRSQNDGINIQPALTAGTIIINNSGRIESTGVNANNGQAIDFGNIVAAGASVTINNNAAGVIQTADADGIRPGTGATINNAGTITSNNFQTNSGSDGIDFQNSLSGTVNNLATGVISGGRHGVNLGLDLTVNATTSSITVTNEAGGQIIGRNGSGVGVDASAVVTNYGLISGRADSIAGVANGDGDGVDIDYIGTIVNFGRIEGLSAKGVGSDTKPNTAQGLALGGGTVDNRAGATIYGLADGILVDNSSEGPAFAAVTISNAGTITGEQRYGVRLISNFNNVINNSGVISGATAAIVFGSGDDTLNLSTGSVINGLIDGGAGNDVINLSGTGMLGSTVNFETLNVGGVWTLTGAQTYSSAVNILAGATAVAAGTLSGPVNLNGAALTVSGTLNGSLNAFAGSTLAISGSLNGNVSATSTTINVSGALNGALTANSGTSVTLSGAVSGAATLNSGASITMSGSIGGLATVASGASLTGTGSVGGLALAGAISPGGSSIATLAVNGNLAISAGATYQVQATPAGTADKIAATGSATLSGGTVQLTVSPGDYATVTRYPIVTATGGVTGALAGVSASLAFLTPSLSYDANNAYLVLTRNAAQMQSVAATTNQRGVASAIDQLPTSSTIYQTLLTQSTAGAQAIFSSLSGEGSAGAQATGQANVSAFTSTLGDQIQGWRTGSESGNATTAGVEPLGYAARSRPVKTPIVVRDPVPAPAAPALWRLWGQGFGADARVFGNAAAGMSSITQRGYGGLMGLDYRFRPDAIVGFAIGGSDSRFNMPAVASSGTTQGVHASIYGAIRQDQSYATGSITLSSFANKTTRIVSGIGVPETENGLFRSVEWRGRVEAGRDFVAGPGFVTPFAAVEVASLRTAGYTETSTAAGGGPGLLGLTYQGRTNASLPIFLGARLRGSVDLGSGMRLEPVVSLAWAHEFYTSRAVTSAFNVFPGAAFTTFGARAAADSAQVKAGLNLSVSKQATIFASLNGEFSNASRVLGGAAGLQLSW